MTVIPTANPIPLYQYQKEISDELSEFALDNDIEITIKNCKLIIKGNAVYLTAPLGSGKTRIISLSIKKILESSSFEEKNHFFRIKDQTSVIKDSCKSKIFIIVPVSIIDQWEKELVLWKISYYKITMPRHIQPLEDITETVVLMSDYRTKDTHLHLAKDIITPKKFISTDFQIYLFIDEFDTIKLNNTFITYINDMTKTKICFSAFYNGKDFFPGKFHEVNIKQFKVDDQTVKKIITLPPIKEKIAKISLSKIFNDILPYLSKELTTFIMTSNITSMFEMYKVRKQETLLHLFNAFIEERQHKITHHLSLLNTTRDAFTQKQDDEIAAIDTLITKHLAMCHKCKGPISSVTQCFNCTECLSLVCDKCRFPNDYCDICIDIYKGNPVDLSKLSEFNKNRSHCLMEILFSIRARDVVSQAGAISKSPKKVLVYCADENLVYNLNRILENNNFWSMSLIGSTAQRLNMINKFKEVDTDIYMICNSIQNSAGIHLPETTDIIIYHELEDRYDTQVIGRAQRIGRKDSLYLHRIQNSTV